MQIPNTLRELSKGLRQVPPPPSPGPSDDNANVFQGIVGGAAGAVIDSVGLGGTTIRQSLPFQLKAQKDLWNSDHQAGYKLAWTAGLVGINAAAICLSPLIGAVVGAIYGYQAGSQEGLGAAVRESAGVVGFVNTFMGDTFRDQPRREGELEPPSPEQVKVRYVTQDPLITPPIVGQFPKSMMGQHLNNDRIIMDDNDPLLPTPSKARPPVSADAQGNYLHDPGTPEFQQVESFLGANLALNLYEKALGRKIPWSFEGPLKVHPHAGEGFNAYYARQFHSINFFDGADPVQGRTIHGSESLDVTSHEVGHAVLDAMKPGLMSWFSGIEGPSFHESFGDITAILTALHQDTLLDKVVNETQGDLHKPNTIARMAEEFSLGINNGMLGASMPADWVMRDANNDFKYQDPATLPQKPDSIDDLFREPHSFSRVFTGAFWDLLCSVNRGYQEAGASPKEALVQTRDTMTQLMAHTLELSPNRMKRLSQATQAMLAADERYLKGQLHDQISQAMAGRNLLPATSSAQLPQLTLDRKLSNLEAADDWRAAQAQVLPGSEVPLQAESLWVNDKGETFVRYSAVAEVELDPKTLTDLGTSLTLGFGSDGQLFHSQWEPIDEESVSLARQEVQHWRDKGAIAGTSVKTAANGSAPTRMMGQAVPVERFTTKGLGPQVQEKILRIPQSAC